MAGLAVRMDLKDGFFMIGIMPIINQGSNGVNGYGTGSRLMVVTTGG